MYIPLFRSYRILVFREHSMKTTFFTCSIHILSKYVTETQISRILSKVSVLTVSSLLVHCTFYNVQCTGPALRCEHCDRSSGRLWGLRLDPAGHGALRMRTRQHLPGGQVKAFYIAPADIV
jgi:hypothetical protein